MNSLIHFTSRVKMPAILDNVRTFVKSAKTNLTISMLTRDFHKFTVIPKWQIYQQLITSY